MPKSDILAVAFTDLNGNDKYNPGKDELIAALVDTNKDGTVSVGDTIEWGTYPAIPDGSNSGTGGIYTSLDTEIINVIHADNFDVIVETESGVVEFFSSPNVEEFITNTEDPSEESRLTDNINLPGLNDLIFTDPDASGAGQPNTSLDVSTLQLGDQGFLDVYIGDWWLV